MITRNWRAGLALGTILFLSAPLLSQSCALCYTQAAASGRRVIGALRNGILVLIVPPMFMSAGITWLAYTKRNQFRQDAEDGDPENFDE